MEMMFLILLINREGVAIPQPYPKEQCEKIASGYEGYAGRVTGFCIPAPVFKYSEPSRTPYPGYYCGQFDCTLNNGAK